MYVCICNSVTDSQIERAVRSGAGSFREVRKCLNLGSECGKCVKLAKDVFETAAAEAAGPVVAARQSFRQTQHQARGPLAAHILGAGA